MTALQGPPLCEEYILLEGYQKGICYRELTTGGCPRQDLHMTQWQLEEWSRAVDERVEQLQRRYLELLEDES